MLVIIIFSTIIFRLQQLGVKKVKHLSDVTDDHLVNMGMLEIEKKRFYDKLLTINTESKPLGIFQISKCFMISFMDMGIDLQVFISPTD